MPASSNSLLLGTAKGLVIIDLIRNPKIVEVHFAGFAVNMVFVDERNGRWWIGVSHKHWGQKLHYSDTHGADWYEIPAPKFNGAKLPNGSVAKLRQIWCMQSGGGDQPDVLWLGTDPGGLFVSKDGGKTFNLVEGLWNHPSRRNESQWFGAGSDFPYIHSIVLNPKNSNHLYVAVSCAGVFESRDNGATWQARNKGLTAAYLPNPNAEVGHDPHALKIPGSHANVLWQQNHCGIFLSTDAGETWKDVSANSGLPSYGFALAVDDNRPARAWVIPADSDEKRIAPNLELKVFETNNYGSSWEDVSNGLPYHFAFDIALRQAFTQRDDYLVFGTTNGNVYLSKGPKPSWQTIAENLAKVNCTVLTN